MNENPFASTTGEGGGAIALTKVRNDNFPPMKEWIQNFFKSRLLVSHIPA